MTKVLGPEDHFKLVDGKKARSLTELAEALDRIDDLVYSFHVTDEKNDFATWVEEKLEESEVATRLRQAKNLSEARNVLNNTLGRKGVATVESSTDAAATEERRHTMMDAHAFEQYHNSQAEVSERISDKFDAFLKRVEERMEPDDGPLQKNVAKLQEEVGAYKEAISDLRKQGKDPFIATLLLRQASPKIAYAKASGNPEDLARARQVLEQVKWELASVRDHKEVDVRKEVEALTAQDARQFETMKIGKVDVVKSKHAQESKNNSNAKDNSNKEQVHDALEEENAEEKHEVWG